MPSIVQERVAIQGSRDLIGEFAYPEQAPLAACLLVNPHPYMGGSMGNNIIAALASALPEAGLATLRFDYSGVGESRGLAVDVAAGMAEFWSTGHAPIDAAMVGDAAVALAWLQRQLQAPLVTVGYSFGAYVAAKVTPQQARGLILISPTVSRHAFDAVAFPRVPTLVIDSDNDFASSVADLDRFFGDIPDPKQHCRIPGAEHFFLGFEATICDACRRFVLEQVHAGEATV